MDQSTNGLPEQAVNYLQKKRIPDLIEHILHELIVHQPENPLKYLAQTLASPVTLKLILCGPPAGGKHTQAEMLSEKFGLVLVSARDLLTKEVSRGGGAAKQIDAAMGKGELVADSVVTDLIHDRLKQEDAVKKGWLLEGFPRTKNQALSLQTAGLLPKAFIHIDLPEATISERVEGRRVDPKTGRTYHLTFDPPTDPDVISRLEQRADDTKERANRRLAAYQRNTIEIEHCYKSVIHRVCRMFF